MDYVNKVHPELAAVLAKSPYALDPKQWSIPLISACIFEMRSGNEILLGAGNMLPLPMPNLVYTARAMLENAPGRGRLPVINNVIQMCTEVHLILAAELLARYGGDSVEPIDLTELIARSRISL